MNITGELPACRKALEDRDRELERLKGEHEITMAHFGRLHTDYNALQKAARAVHEACWQADYNGELSEYVDGVLLDNLSDLLSGGPKPANTVIGEVLEERSRQDGKWGERNYNLFKWLAILGEEVGEANRGALDDYWTNYRNELIQVAAVAIAAVESLDRGKWKERK